MKQTIIILFLLLIVSQGFSQNRELYDTLAHYTSFDAFMKTSDASMKEKLDSIKGKNDSNGINQKKWKIVISKWKDLSDYRQRYNKNVSYRTKSDGDKMEEKWGNFRNYLDNNKAAIFPDAYDSSLIKRLNKVKENVEHISDTAQRIYFLDSAFFDTTIKKADSIQKQTRIIDTTTKRVDSTAKRIDTITNSIKKIIDTSVLPNQDSLKYFLYKRDTTIQKIITAAGYQDGLYSIGYSQVWGNKNSFSPLIVLGEFFFPVNSQIYKHAGGFLSAGVQHKSMAFFAGIGYINNNTTQNISWKGTFFYFPYHCPVGFGLTYSPLTTIGIMLTLKLK